MATSHVTTRFSVVFGFSMAVLLLIPLWVVFGVFGEAGSSVGHAEGGGHSAHGPMGKGAQRQAFLEEAQAFIAENTRSDGCVAPAVPMEEEHHGEAKHMAEAGEERVPVVYLQAFQWGYNPARLCLESGKTYEFRMMALNVIHGASLQLGSGSKMVRLPPGVRVAQRVTFTKPGKYLLYCSYYCGLGHQVMQGEIIVEPASAPGDHEKEHDLLLTKEEEK